MHGFNNSLIYKVIVQLASLCCLNKTEICSFCVTIKMINKVYFG